jgi:hypothetical protein
MCALTPYEVKQSFEDFLGYNIFDLCSAIFPIA